MSTHQGEGNREADRRYREGVQETVDAGDIEKDAQEAKKARESPETREELDEAERRAKEGPEQS